MNFSDIQVLCVGDVMLDRFVHCDMERISPEAPVPILRLRGTREMLGGAGNVASNVAALGGTAVLAGLVGQDAAGDAVRRLLRGVPRLVSAAVDTPSRPTTCKTRPIAANQQVVRADEESLAAVTAAEEAGLLNAVRVWIGRVGAVVLSDYGKGALAPGLVARVVGLARATGVPVFVDPKSPDFTHYRGAACITPNLKELAAAAGMAVDGEDAIVQAARRVLAQAEAGAILATRSEKGMTLVEASGAVQSVPARARAVFDVSGAGDTVIAALALCCAAGRTLAQAMHVANAAASVVSKPGTATATVQELDAQDHDQDHDRLFRCHLFDPATGTLGEFFADDWTPAPGDAGTHVEPGHHMEWAWLLEQYARLTGRDAEAEIGLLYGFALCHGTDPATGLIWDAVGRDGTPWLRGFHLWPQTEALKAHAVMARRGGDGLALVVPAVRGIGTRFLQGCLAGAWTDQLDAAGTPASRSIPTSSLHHVFMAYAELDGLARRPAPTGERLPAPSPSGRGPG